MILELTGCTHDSLGSYLKSLAVLRLVTQKDRNARGYWGAACFVLDCDLDGDGLVDFFLKEYRPTPALAPWNGASGFYPKDRKVGFKAILETSDFRFESYRRDLLRAQAIVAETGGDRKEAKSEIVRRCRNELSNECVEWIDAAIALAATESLAFAPVLGTGGNEGHLDYTNNFMERLSELLIKPDKKTPIRELLGNALFGAFSAGLQDIAVGQYDPGRAGGFNQGERIEGSAVVNPWNAVLTLEGAAAWAGGIYRKQGVAYRSFLCSPFTVKPSAVGFGSACTKDEESARAEIWAPLWSKPARFGEIRALLREGRASLDGKPAKTGLDFAQAAGLLGVDRGIDAFVRFSLLKRRGDSYIALRTGQFAARYRKTADLIRELSPFVEAAGRAAKKSSGEVPNSWPPLERAAAEAIFQALLHDRENLLVEVAGAFGAMHRWLLLRNREVRWPARLSEQWIRSLWSKPEARIAASLAGMWSKEAGALAENLNPAALRFSWIGRDLPARMLATLKRRTLDGAGADESPFASKLRAKRTDAIQFVEHALDDRLIEDLTFAFAVAKFPDGKSLRSLATEDQPRPWLRWPSYCLLKQFFARQTHPSPNAPPDEPRFRPDMGITSLLAADAVDRALEAAIRRMRIAGLQPVISKPRSAGDGTRLAGALLIPVQGVMDLQQSVTRAEEAELEELKV